EWRDEDAPRLLDIRRRPEITRWFGTTAPMADEAEARQKVAAWRAISADPRLGSWAIWERGAATPAGTVLLKLVEGSAPEEVEVGWYLHPDAMGRGLASEAARGAIAKAFADGWDEVFAYTHTDNHPSRRVAAR